MNPDIENEISKVYQSLRDEFDKRLKESVESLKAILIGPSANKYLRTPMPDDTYFYLNEVNDVCKHYFTSDAIDGSRISIGNCFLNPSLANDLRNHRNKWGKLERLIIEFNDGWLPDWEDNKQTKGTAYWNLKRQAWQIGKNSYCMTQGVIYFDYSRSDEMRDLLNKHFPNGV